MQEIMPDAKTMRQQCSYTGDRAWTKPCRNELNLNQEQPLFIFCFIAVGIGEHIDGINSGQENR